MKDLATAWRPFEPSSDAVIDDDTRCAVCGWQMPDPVKGTAGFMCRPGDCCHRPRPASLYAPERAKAEAEDLHQRALRNGMPPSGRWA